MTVYKNDYKAPSVDIPPNIHLDTKAEDYDLNFCLPVPSKPLRTDKVELRPFIPSEHAKLIRDAVDSDWDLLQYLGVKTKWETVNEVCEWQEETARLLPGTLRFAIYSAPLDKPKAPAEDYQFAGTLSLHESNYDNMLSEIGWVCILKPFQRTHVNTHACALLMHYILDSEAEGGLGLRRLQWKANSLNKPSHKAAMRLGFKEEGVLRALVVLPEGTEGVAAGRPGRNEGRQQRDTWMASVTWKEWEDGVREHVDRLVAGIGK